MTAWTGPLFGFWRARNSRYCPLVLPLAKYQMVDAVREPGIADPSLPWYLMRAAPIGTSAVTDAAADTFAPRSVFALSVNRLVGGTVTVLTVAVPLERW